TVRRTRYTKSSGFNGTSSNSATVLASIPLGTAADMNNKRLFFLANVQKTGANANSLISAYLHNAAIAEGSTSIPTEPNLIGTFQTSTALQDNPFVRERMYVSAGKLYASRPENNTIQNDSIVSQSNPMSEFTLPTTPHIILV